MTSHFFLSSYYQEILTPENLVFKTNILTRAGPRTVISEPVEKAYSCIANIYAFGATRAKSVDSEAVRVSQWGSPTTAGSTITVNQNNQLSGVVRVGQAINVAGSMRYRVVFGDSPATRFTSSPTRGQGINEGEMCYFGPVTQIPSSWDPLRIVALVITIACMVMFAFLMAFVIYYRKMVVIRHSGLHFLMLTLSGCFINLFYIFIVFPVEKASWHCVAEFWPLHLGFITVFGALLQKVYAIFQSTQKRRFLKGNRQSQQTFWIQVISASIFFMLYMILRSVFQEDLIETFTTDLIPWSFGSENLELQKWNVGLGNSWSRVPYGYHRNCYGTTNS
ncbi:hypothetical protein BC829DRAFT_233943 [Chytridium lagenaria]|nr:hypothetical protein BC829DRAFT_233943 [Chytridium lagenaria]